MADYLNRGVLPSDYFAAAEQVATHIEADKPPGMRRGPFAIDDVARKHDQLAIRTSVGERFVTYRQAWESFPPPWKQEVEGLGSL